jgi:hypothetical protein
VVSIVGATISVAGIVLYQVYHARKLWTFVLVNTPIDT